MMAPRAHLIPRLALMSVLALATPAFAQEDTATVDQTGPPTAEYAIPLQTAREDAANGSDDKTSKSEKKTPLFGVGVKSAQSTPAPQPATTPAPQPATTPKAKKAVKRKVRHKRVVNAAGASKTVILPTALPASAPASGPGTSATIGGLAVAVLLLGGVLGSIARRRRT
jgi:hypothetical protein